MQRERAWPQAGWLSSSRQKVVICVAEQGGEFRQEGDHWLRDIETSDQPVDPANLSVLADDLQADSRWTQSLLQRSSSFCESRIFSDRPNIACDHEVASLSDGCDKMPLVPTCGA